MFKRLRNITHKTRKLPLVEAWFWLQNDFRRAIYFRALTVAQGGGGGRNVIYRILFLPPFAHEVHDVDENAVITVQLFKFDYVCLFIFTIQRGLSLFEDLVSEEKLHLRI